jgi:hypothetical protein
LLSPPRRAPNFGAWLSCIADAAAGAGHTRHNFDAKVPLDALADYYLPAFKGCVMEGKVKGIMCSYNAVNGVPMCANAKVRKMPSWPRSWANFSLFWLHSHMNAWANLDLFGPT